MGGWGSGRHRRYATKTDELLSIDLADLKRWGVLGSWRSGSLQWSRGGVVHSSAGYEARPDGLRLRYRNGRGDGAREVNEFIPYSYTAQRLGGERAWFTCLSCKRRCRIIYGGDLFRCRACYRAVYPSQYSPFPEGKVNRALRIRQRLSDEWLGIDDPFPPKPKGMHWKTYDRLIEAHEEGYRQFCSAIGERYLPLFEK